MSDLALERAAALENDVYAACEALHQKTLLVCYSHARSIESVIASMALQAMRALLLTPILLAAALRPSTPPYASLPRRAAFDASLHRTAVSGALHRVALGAVAGGLGDAGPADDAAVRAWASQLRAVAAKRSPPAAAGVAVGLAGRVAATGRVSPKLAARLVFGSFVLLSTALVAPERAVVAKRQKRVPAVVVARQLAIAAGAAVVASIAPTRRSAVALAVLAAVARWARGGEDGFAARVATKAAELRASRAYVPDGLSVEEYAETKLREEDYKKSLDLGAWGPRFKRTAAPGAFGKAWVASFWMGGRPPPPPARYE